MKLKASIIKMFFILVFTSSLSASTQVTTELNILKNEQDTTSIYIDPDKWYVNDKEEDNYYKDYIPEIIPEYFLLGTLNNYYMGRFYGLRENQIDYYLSYEESLMDYLKEYIQEHFGISVERQETDRNSIVLYSAELSKILNSFYNEKGYLEESLFDSDEKIYSFLLGSYYRFGYQVSERLYGMWRYDNIVYFLLKKAMCNKILCRDTKYRLPGSTIYYFKPSVFLKKYLTSIAEEKEKFNELSGGEGWRYEFELKRKTGEEQRDLDELIEEVFDRLGQ